MQTPVAEQAINAVCWGKGATGKDEVLSLATRKTMMVSPELLPGGEELDEAQQNALLEWCSWKTVMDCGAGL